MAIIVEIHRQKYTHAIDKVKLDDGRILDIADAIKAVDNAEIEGVTTAKSRTGTPYIRAKRSWEGNGNLNDLPEF